MVILQIQRTEVGHGERRRRQGSNRPPSPVSMLIADGPNEAESTAWVAARFDVDARPDDQLAFLQLNVLQQARAVINDQIAMLEKRVGRWAAR